MLKNKNYLRPIMFVGTGSDVGKSVINAGFCRILLQDGFSPAPFKAQNMSLNSYATPNGLEIGRAQAVQAEACGIECMAEMNPVLLKPTSDMKAQVILNGKPVGTQSASEYFNKIDRYKLFNEAIKSFNTLAQKYNPVVIEGAGSISELNLRDKDITNMRVALKTGAATFLIADIDRGGVFGSIYGTIELLTPEERKLIKGIIINKFRGDINLFTDGKQILEKLTGVPVIGVLPYFNDIIIDDEDSVALKKKIKRESRSRIDIAVVLLRHMSNFTDFNVLELMPEVNLFYSHDEEEVQNADIVIIPGSKNTISDLMYLRKTGMAKAILKAYKKGKSVYGICGGYQMMGKEIHDPFHVESDVGYIPGLGILPVKTTLTKEKITKQCHFSFRDKTGLCKGYEIHMGETETNDNSPLCKTDTGFDGYYLNNKAWGTYIHGIFDNALVINEILKQVQNVRIKEFDIKSFKDRQYNKLATLIRKNSDMEYIYKVLKP